MLRNVWLFPQDQTTSASARLFSTAYTVLGEVTARDSKAVGIKKKINGDCLLILSTLAFICVTDQKAGSLGIRKNFIFLLAS